MKTAGSPCHGHDAHRCCGCATPPDTSGLTRRDFLGSSVLGGAALTGLTWPALAADGDELPSPPPRRTLVVQPVLIYDVPTPHPHTSWRSWGGIQTEEEARQEVARIGTELEQIKKAADFPVEFLPTAAVRNVKAIEKQPELARADVLLVYAAGGGLDGIQSLNKHVVVFLRHQSGPVSLWYEIVSPRLLRQHTDEQKLTTLDPTDVVVDKLDEVVWRLRSLCGFMNTYGTKIIAVGGAGGWAQPAGSVPALVKKLWKWDIQELSYAELGPMIQAARADKAAMQLAEKRAAAALALPNTKLETDKTFVVNALLLDHVFRKIMAQAGCGAITINACMGTIMGMAETSACMTLSTLNDAGYMAFCESDFVVIPAGRLMASIAGKPMFLNDPTYPHDGLITLAHCTAPRKLDGRNPEPVRILSHFESDYGAAPKVEMKTGQVVTNIIPDFAGKRWVGFKGEIACAPFLPICRSQIDVKFTCDSEKLAEHMPGFHWMTIYGDYLRETGYALKKIPIAFECLG